jgi:hypothetical protein
MAGPGLVVAWLGARLSWIPPQSASSVPAYRASQYPSPRVGQPKQWLRKPLLYPLELRGHIFETTPKRPLGVRFDSQSPLRVEKMLDAGVQQDRAGRGELRTFRRIRIDHRSVVDTCGVTALAFVTTSSFASVGKVILSVSGTWLADSSTAFANELRSKRSGSRLLSSARLVVTVIETWCSTALSPPARPCRTGRRDLSRDCPVAVAA